MNATNSKLLPDVCPRAGTVERALLAGIAGTFLLRFELGRASSFTRAWAQAGPELSFRFARRIDPMGFAGGDPE